MAKSKKLQNSWSSVAFVNVSLDAKQRKEFKTWYETSQADAEILLHDFITGGWKMSVRWDDENDCFIAAHTCHDEASDNHNSCITSRSDVLVEAMLLNYFKVAIICRGDLTEAKQPDNWG